MSFQFFHLTTDVMRRDDIKRTVEVEKRQQGEFVEDIDLLLLLVLACRRISADKFSTNKPSANATTVKP
jgi:hypothetical protein